MVMHQCVPVKFSNSQMGGVSVRLRLIMFLMGFVIISRDFEKSCVNFHNTSEADK